MRFKVTANDPDDLRMAKVVEAYLNYLDYYELMEPTLYGMLNDGSSLDWMTPEGRARVEQTRNHWKELLTKLGETNE